MRIVFLLFVSFWGFLAGSMSLSMLPLFPWGLFLALLAFAVPLFAWSIYFRAQRRASMIKSGYYYEKAPRKVFWKAAGWTLLVLVGLNVVAWASLFNAFLPEFLQGPAAVMAIGGFGGWALVLIPVLVGWGVQLRANTAPPPKAVWPHGRMPLPNTQAPR